MAWILIKEPNLISEFLVQIPHDGWDKISYVLVKYYILVGNLNKIWSRQVLPVDVTMGIQIPVKIHMLLGLPPLLDYTVHVKRYLFENAMVSEFEMPLSEIQRFG